MPQLGLIFGGIAVAPGIHPWELGPAVLGAEQAPNKLLSVPRSSPSKWLCCVLEIGALAYELSVVYGCKLHLSDALWLHYPWSFPFLVGYLNFLTCKLGGQNILAEILAQMKSRAVLPLTYMGEDCASVINRKRVWILTAVFILDFFSCSVSK